MVGTADEILIFYWMFLLDLQANPPVFNPVTVEAAKFFGTPLAEGFINVQKFEMTGFDTMHLASNLDTQFNVSQVDTDGKIFKLCSNLPIGQINMYGEYLIDVGINNSIPIYGEGTFEISATDITLDFCTLRDLTQNRVHDTDLRMRYLFNPIKLTGFYKSEESNEVINNIVNMAITELALWSSYEPLKASCIHGRVLERFLNILYVKNPNTSFNFDPSCLQGSMLRYLQHLYVIIPAEIREILEEIILQSYSIY